MSAPTRLWNRNFGLLATGLLISYIGDAFFAVGILWLAYSATGSTLVAGTLMAVYGLPPLLLGPFAGALVDMSNKRWLMIIGDGARGLVVLSLFLVETSGGLSLWVLYPGVLLLSIFDTLYKPSLRVLVPTLVPETALQSANSFIQGSQQVAQVVGPAVAAVVVTRMGTNFTLLADALSFFLSALALYLVRFPAHVTGSRKVTPAAVLRNTWEGLHFIFGQAELFFIVGLAFTMNLVLTPVNVIFPVFSQTTIGSGAQGFAYLAAAIGAGSLLGTVMTGLAGKWLRGRFSMFVGIAIMAGAFIGLSYAGSLLFALACTAMLGIAAPLVQIPMVTQLQQEVPVTKQGRVFGTFSTLTTASVPLGAALAGSALARVTPPALFRAAALGLFAVLLLLEGRRRLSMRVRNVGAGAEASRSQ